MMISIQTLIAIINFGSLIVSFILMSYLYLLSVQPMKRSEQYGEKAWEDCKKLRSFGGFFELIATINMILWIWFPLPIVGDWKIGENIWIGIIIGICILVPCGIIMIKGILDAGSETLAPSKSTEMYGGIYNYIRHPQTLGEFPMFVAFGFIFNSWFLVIISAVGIITYIPIMIHYEEKDLLKRFGEKYRKYQERTGALFPKLRKKHNKEL
jgi:protein-S-isoprenylcysteine O-methyltransferase Ste14